MMSVNIQYQTSLPVVTFLLFMCFSIEAQQSVDTSPSAQPDPCPTITVDCPQTLDEPDTFEVVVRGISDHRSLSYTWQTYNARIISGQGTTKIVFEVIEPYQGVTATATIGGLEPRCVATASCTFITHQPVPAQLFASYGGITLRLERARLSAFAESLRKRPGAIGYIVVYGKIDGRGGRAKRYLVKECGLEGERLVVVVKGRARQKTSIELYVVPQGAQPPTAEGRERR